MLENRRPIPAAEAMRLVMDAAPLGTTEVLPLGQSLGYILAQNACAAEDLPPFNRSAFDGYALRAGDTAGAGPGHPVAFEVVEDVPAGRTASVPVGAFQAVRIMTGAPVPSDCDAVVMLEWTREEEAHGRRQMFLKHAVKPGDNISFRGEEAAKGTVLLPKGTAIHPGTIALLASLGYDRVEIGRKPLVAVAATGSELVDAGEPLTAGMIRNSNGPMVCAQVERAGGQCRYYGTVPDRFESCLETVRTMLREADLIVTTGGVSIGDYDYMPQLYKELGAKVLFNKVAMRPGSVTTVAELEGKLLFGLSGNPSACYIGFELFARPVIRKMLQEVNPYPLKIQAVLGKDFPKANPFTRFVRAKTSIRGGAMAATPVGLDKSSAVVSLSQADSVIVLPGGTRGYREGALVDVLLLESAEGGGWPWNGKADGPADPISETNSVRATNHVLQVIGYKNSGKTTLICSLVEQLSALGYRVGTIKHDAHDFAVDQPGTDTWKHSESGAVITAISSANNTALIERRGSDLDRLIRMLSDMDIILVEGFKQADYCKLVVIRSPEDLGLLQTSTNIAGIVSWIPLEYAGAPVYNIGEAEAIVQFITSTTYKR